MKHCTTTHVHEDVYNVNKQGIKYHQWSSILLEPLTNRIAASSYRKRAIVQVYSVYTLQCKELTLQNSSRTMAPSSSSLLGILQFDGSRKGWQSKMSRPKTVQCANYLRRSDVSSPTNLLRASTMFICRPGLLAACDWSWLLTYKEREKERERETETETERGRHRRREEETERDKETERKHSWSKKGKWMFIFKFLSHSSIKKSQQLTFLRTVYTVRWYWWPACVLNR